MRDYIDIILLLSYNFSILLQVFQVFGDILDALHSNFIVLSQAFKRRKTLRKIRFWADKIDCAYGIFGKNCVSRETFSRFFSL